MRKRVIHIENIRGTWQCLITIGKRVDFCATADDLATILEMAKEGYETMLTASWHAGRATDD